MRAAAETDSLTGRVAAQRSIRTLLACGSPAIGETVRDALLLRALATALLRGLPDGAVAAAVTNAAGCSVRGWRTFLINERCALWLHEKLVERKLLAQLSTHGHSVLLEVRQEELRRVLTARAQLAMIERLADAAGEPIVVLKGGVAAVSGSPMVDLHDVDILPAAEYAEVLARELDAHGYAPVRRVDGRYHLAARGGDNLLLVEIHTSTPWADANDLIGMRADAQPIVARGTLLRPSAPDHLWYLLAHVVLQHVDRAGSIRDQLLMRDAAAQCTDAELQYVRERIRSHAAATVLASALDGALHDATSCDDDFLRVSAARYAVTAAIFSRGSAAPMVVAKPLKALTLDFTVGSSGAYWRRMRESTKTARAGRFIKAANPSIVTRGVVAMLRTLRVVALTPAAAVLAFQSAQVARSFNHSNWRTS